MSIYIYSERSSLLTILARTSIIYFNISFVSNVWYGEHLPIFELKNYAYRRSSSQFLVPHLAKCCSESKLLPAELALLLLITAHRTFSCFLDQSYRQGGGSYCMYCMNMHMPIYEFEYNHYISLGDNNTIITLCSDSGGPRLTLNKTHEKIFANALPINIISHMYNCR